MIRPTQSLVAHRWKQARCPQSCWIMNSRTRTRFTITPQRPGHRVDLIRHVSWGCARRRLVTQLRCCGRADSQEHRMAPRSYLSSSTSIAAAEEQLPSVPRQRTRWLQPPSRTTIGHRPLSRKGLGQIDFGRSRVIEPCRHSSQTPPATPPTRGLAVATFAISDMAIAPPPPASSEPHQAAKGSLASASPCELVFRYAALIALQGALDPVHKLPSLDGQKAARPRTRHPRRRHPSGPPDLLSRPRHIRRSDSRRQVPQYGTPPQGTASARDFRPATNGDGMKVAVRVRLAGAPAKDRVAEGPGARAALLSGH